MKTPPATLKILWCPACGRDNQVRNLRKHYSGGRLCVGVPIEVIYDRRKQLAAVHSSK